MLKTARLVWIALIAIPLMFATAVDAAVTAEYQEGVHYTKLDQPVRTQDPSKVEIVELFGYWCPHCNSFERYLRPWKKGVDDKGAYFKEIPVVFSASHEEYAKAYYIAEVLGVEDETHSALFSLIHRQRQSINNKQQLGEFFANYDVDAKKFSQIYDSFAINGKMLKGRKQAMAYQITGVPSLVVNGKYLITAQTAGSQVEMLKVVDFLIEKEKAQ